MACSQLSAIPALTVALPNSVVYNATEHAYWSLQEASLTPACIVLPSTSQQVAEIVSNIVNNRTQFAIKAGGHAATSGFANIDYGITIDLTKLSHISVSTDASVASVGAGAKWLDVYAALDPLNKTVAGGRNGGVGVGGLTIGGGISYFSPQAGFTCDTVVNFEVVLASGRVVNANHTSHADLFRALKGGLNNFGVVTRFDFSTLSIGAILAGSVVNNILDRNAVFAALASIADAPEYDIHASIVTNAIFTSSSKLWTLSSTPIYTATETHPRVYEELFAIPGNSSSMHLTSLHDFANETAGTQSNFLLETTTFGVSAALFDVIFNIVNASICDYQVAGGIRWIVSFEPLPAVLVAHGAHQNSLGTSGDDGNSMILLLTAVWSDTASSDSVHSKAASVLAVIDETVEKMGLSRRFRYANYADRGQRVFEGYGEENLLFLRGVAERYDPKGVFQRLVPGGFKLHTGLA